MNLAAGAQLARASDPFEVPARIHRIRAEMDWAAALPPRAQRASWQVQQRLKRGIDIVMALAGLLVLSPLLVAVAVAVRATSPGAVLYRWRVLGHRARPFVGYKFRTMVDDADTLKDHYRGHNEMKGAAFKMRNDPRVTPLGRWLRKYSIDELPQLWSVLKGDMSMVGPRPPSAEEFVEFEPWQWAKLAVTPGITCLWQVNGRSEINDFAAWARLDLEYIRRWNLLLDFRILLRTIPAVLSGRGAY
jgi:lipopolysaccharide/colanic/teichoic acid biosynthesis glycosyltransferase